MTPRKVILFASLCLILLIGVGTVSAQKQPTKPVIPPLFVAALGQTKKTWSIVMLDPTSNGPEYLTDDKYDEIRPLASPDGRYVVFQRGDFSTDAPLEYYVLDRDCLPKCEPKALPDDVNQMGDLHWSPVGPQLVAWGVDNAVWLIDVEKSSVKQVIAGTWYAYPSWSPDGSTIVVSSDVVPPDAMLSDDIQLVPAEVNADDSDRVDLTYNGLFVEDSRPYYSPDGDWIAYTTRNLADDTKDKFQDNPFALLMIGTSCIKKPKTCPDERQLMSKDGHMVTDFAWSPDSSHIAYMDGNPLDTNNRYGNLWVVDVQSGKVQQLTEGNTTGDFSWAPDSSAVVYERVTDSSLDVYLTFLDGRSDPGPVLEGFRASATPYWAYR